MRLSFDIGQILLSFFSSLKSSVNCLNKKDKIFAPMDDDRPCLSYNSKKRRFPWFKPIVAFSISIELQLQSILEKVQKQKLIKPPLDYFDSCMVIIFLEISKERVCVF